MPHHLPEMHYITEPERAQLYPAIIRVSSIPSIPSTFPFKVPQSPPRTRGPRYTIGWLEFQSPEQPDPEVARPGDVWIQLPIGHRKARVYACYARDGNDWSPWVGNSATVLTDRTMVRTHPFLGSDHAQRRFYLVFNGREFTWANIKAISNVQHHHSHTARMGPAEAVSKWLGVSGNRGALSPRKAKEERSTSAATGISSAKDKHAAVSAPPIPNRKRGRPPAKSTGATESASAPPAKKRKRTPSEQPASAPESSPLVRSGPYAKAGATQRGWFMYVAGKQLKMRTRCSGCAKDKTPCSGLPGQRCGRCRFRKTWCSHSKSTRRTPLKKKDDTPDETETDTDTVEDRSSPVVAKAKSRLRSAQKSRTSTKAKRGAQRKSNGSSRVRFSSTVSDSDSDSDSGSSSPLSSVDSQSNSDSESESSEEEGDDDDDDELDAPDDRDDVAVENLLNNAAPTFMGLTRGGADDGEPSSSGGGVYRSLPGADATAEEDEEEEELARFVQMTLDGMARVQEGLRGVFTLQRRKSGLARRSSASPAKQVTGA